MVLRCGHISSDSCSKLMLNPGPWCTGLYGGFAGTPAEFSAGNNSGDPALTSIVINVLKIGATTSWLFFWLWTEWNCPPQYLQHNLNKLKNRRPFRPQNISPKSAVIFAGCICNLELAFLFTNIFGLFVIKFDSQKNQLTLALYFEH